MDRMIIGNVGRAQGIKGELRLNLFSDNADKYVNLKHAYIGGIVHTIESFKVQPNGIIVKFVGVNDRNAAELYVNKTFEIDKVNAVKPPAGSYYIVDLIGCDVVDDNGENLGKLNEILQHGAADVYVVIGGQRDFMFPALKDVIIDTDIATKLITVRGSRLKEIVVYED